MLTWQWNQKCGEIKDRYGVRNLYQGNALLIALTEYRKNDTDMYSLYTFFADKEHMKNMFGLSKKYKEQGNLYEGDWESITLYKNMFTNKKDFKDLVDGITSAFDNITLIIKNSDDIKKEEN